MFSYLNYLDLFMKSVFTVVKKNVDKSKDQDKGYIEKHP